MRHSPFPISYTSLKTCFRKGAGLWAFYLKGDLYAVFDPTGRAGLRGGQQRQIRALCLLRYLWHPEEHRRAGQRPAQGPGGRRVLRRQLHCRFHEGGGKRPCIAPRPAHRDHPALAAHRGPGDAVLLRRGKAGRRPLWRQLPGLSAGDEPPLPQAGPYLQRGCRVRVLSV